MHKVSQRDFTMTSSQLTRYKNNKNKSMSEITKIREHDHTGTLPSWQVKYSDYGGLKTYTFIRNMYWNISNYYIDKEGRYSATNFPLMGYEESITSLLKQFRKDLMKPIRRYEKN